MPKQLHRSFQDAQVLKIGRNLCFALLKACRQDSENLKVAHKKRGAARAIDPTVRENILLELGIEKRLIADRCNPLRTSNYTYIKNRLRKTRGQKVSVPTIIKLAKEYDFYRPRLRRKAHDRQTLTNDISRVLKS